MSKLHMAAIAASVLVLMGCGGGGGGSASTPTPTPIAKAEGVYNGTLINGAESGAFQAIILEDDTMWALYGAPNSNGGLTVSGLINGQGTSSNGTYNLTAKDYFYLGSVTNITAATTYVPGVSITGTTNLGTRLSGTTAAVTGYNYNAAALVSGLAGTWSGSLLQGSSTTIAITGSGTYSGIANGCSFNGTITPRPSGKNIFNVTYTNGAANCSVPNLSGQGIGVVSTLNTGKQQLIVAVTNADKSIGTVAFVTK